MLVLYSFNLNICPARSHTLTVFQATATKLDVLEHYKLMRKHEKQLILKNSVNQQGSLVDIIIRAHCSF